MIKYFLPIVLLVLLLMPAALAAGNIKINDFSANVTNGTIPLHTRFIGDVTGIKNIEIQRLTLALKDTPVLLNLHN